MIADTFTPLDLDAARAAPSYWYVGSPYSKYPAGIEEAFVEICRIAAALLRRGIPVFSPIAHTHPLAIHGGIDPLDHEIWLPADEPLMDAAHGLIIAQMESWQNSYGLKVEIARFREKGKPIFGFDPNAYLVPVPPEERRNKLAGAKARPPLFGVCA